MACDESIYPFVGVVTIVLLAVFIYNVPSEMELERDCKDGYCEYGRCSPDPTSSKSCCARNPTIRKQLKTMQYAAKKGCSESGCLCIPNIGSLFIGASIYATRNTVTYRHPQGLPSSELSNKPELVIEPSDVVIGQNWHFVGAGMLVVKLFFPSQISGFTVQHPPSCQIPDGYGVSAPKEFTVLGWDEVDEGEPFVFGNYTYNIAGPGCQTFPVQACSTDRYIFIEFRFLSNHGNPDYTALYKVQIHGDLGPPKFKQDK